MMARSYYHPGHPVANGAPTTARLTITAILDDGTKQHVESRDVDRDDINLSVTARNTLAQRIKADRLHHRTLVNRNTFPTARVEATLCTHSGHEIDTAIAADAEIKQAEEDHRKEVGL